MSTTAPPASPRSLRWRPGRVATYAAMLLVAVVTVTPLVYAAFASLKPLPELMRDPGSLLPDVWAWGNYADAWVRGNFSVYAFNSVVVTGGVVVVDLFASSMLGYVLARQRLAGQRVLEAVLISTLFVGLTTAMLYPQFMIARAAGLDNAVGIVLVEYVGITVVHTYLVKAFVQRLGQEIEESARLDGCGFFGTWWHIGLPLMRPMLATTIILAIQASWNNYQVPLAFSLTAPELRTLTVGVAALKYDAGQGITSYPVILAGAMIALVPMVVAFLLLQRCFVQGWTEGSLR